MTKSISVRLEDFFFAPASALPLAVFRMAVAFTLLLQAALLAPDFFPLFSSNGLLPHALSSITTDSLSARALGVSSWLGWGADFGIPERVVLAATAAAYVSCLVTLLVGWQTRAAAFGAWLLHLALANGQVTTYGADLFAHVALFLLIWVPAGKTASLDSGRKLEPGPLTWGARLGLRTLQIYLAVSYLAAGVEKWNSPQWRSGEAVWRATMLPSTAQIDMSWLAVYPMLAFLGCWFTILVEAAYPIFAFWRPTRVFWVLCAIALHVGIAVTMGLWIFSLIMIAWNVAAFLVPGPALRLPRFRLERAGPEAPVPLS